MDPLAVILLLFVLGLVALFVARPPARRRRAARPSVGQNVSSLLAERERLLTALQELDDDHTLGKIPEEDYPAQRGLLLQQGAEVLRRLDELKAVPPAAPETRRPVRATPASDDDLEDLIARRRSSRKEKTGGFCPHCGKPILLSDRFCPSCGFVLK